MDRPPCSPPLAAGNPHAAEIDQELEGCTKPGDFATDVAQVEALVEIFTSAKVGFAWPSHPIFGKMSHDDWLRWGYLHTDHHLRQFGA